MSVILPLWPRSRLRVVGVALDDAGISIRELARLDVTTDPVMGCRTERLMSARYEPRTSRLGPFTGARLESAIWDPRPADILVAAGPETTGALAPDATRALPWILVLRAWCRLMAVSPSSLVDLCWHRGAGCFSDTPWEVSGTVRHEVALLARMLIVMLHQAPPDELVAHSAVDG